MSDYADKPRPCLCFMGYCYRSLCAEKAERWNKPEAKERKKSTRPQIVSWHKDLSGEPDGK